MTANQIRRTIDLSEEIGRDRLKTLFATGDDLAHCFTFTMLDNGNAADLSGTEKARWYFVKLNKPDEDTVFADGEINGNVITFSLKDSCYTDEGPFALSLKLIGEGTTTVYYGTGNVSKTQGKVYVDEDEIIVTVEELEERIRRVDAWANATVSVETLPPNSEATVTKEETPEGYNLRYGIPAGVPGAVYAQIPLTLLASGWSKVTASSYSYYMQRVYSSEIPDANGDLHLDVDNIDIKNAVDVLEQYGKIWSARTEAGCIRVEAVEEPDIDLPVLVGVYSWVG